MYIPTESELGQPSESRSPEPRRVQYDQSIGHLGQNPVPKFIKLLDHFHIPNIPFLPKIFSSSTPQLLQPQNLNPGYINRNQNTLITHSFLQTELQNLMTQKEPYKSFISRGGILRVALVDLSGSKLAFPNFAGYGSTAAMYAASSAKVAALYTAHQLQFDLNVMMAKNPGSSASQVIAAVQKEWRKQGIPSQRSPYGPPNIQQIFDIKHSPGQPNRVEFNATFQHDLTQICHNKNASQIISRLGFHYIASALWQSGLYDPIRGGLWLGSLYDGGKTKWRASPVGRQFHGITALSLATFFTLLAQERLVNLHASQAMQQLLKPTADCTSFLRDGLARDGISVDRVYSKIGVYKQYVHDAAYIERTTQHGNKLLRYVAVGLAKSRQTAPLYKLIVDLDRLIQANNP
jgi:hypothetical protein